MKSVGSASPPPPLPPPALLKQHVGRAPSADELSELSWRMRSVMMGISNS